MNLKRILRVLLRNGGWIKNLARHGLVGVGWISFLFDVKNLFALFLIHGAVAFFLLLFIWGFHGFLATVAAFIFIYIGGASVFMMQQLGKSVDDRERFIDWVWKDEKKDEQETDEESVS